ncbi:MAG: LysM peptidoglycan-binding domain-containing protein [Bacilli bacterium]|nr:LysM peptidoglycan-binding domain-containing protein [Bacilli bacterium]
MINTITASEYFILGDEMDYKTIKPVEYFDYYNIEKNDSLFTIAQKKNVNPNLLSLLNGLDITDYLYKDQKIMIPKEGFSYYITKEGDTLEILVNMFNTHINNLLKYNQTVYLKEGQLIVNKK